MKSQKKPNAPFSRIMNIIFSDFRCWEVNDVHFEVAIRTQFPPCDVPWWFRHACFHRHCNMNMNERENSLFWPETCLLRRKKFHHRSPPPHTQCVVWGINQTKKKEGTFLHFKFAAFSKAPLSVGHTVYRGWQTKDCTGRDDSIDKRVVRNLLSLETHHYWEIGEYRSHATSQLRRDLGFRRWNGLRMRHILHHMLDNWGKCGGWPWVELLANQLAWNYHKGKGGLLKVKKGAQCKHKHAHANI